MIEQTNNDAEIVPCRYCGARAQQHCINNITNEPLRNNASHIRRAVDAMHAADARNDDADEELF
jgi:hypothetical protein